MLTDIFVVDRLLVVWQSSQRTRFLSLSSWSGLFVSICVPLKSDLALRTIE